VLLTIGEAYQHGSVAPANALTIRPAYGLAKLVFQFGMRHPIAQVPVHFILD
jgi:hypothetical protein